MDTCDKQIDIRLGPHKKLLIHDVKFAPCRLMPNTLEW
jgi:hypothetical protein